MPKLIIANWKSHKSATQAQAWFKELATAAQSWDPAEVQVVVAPPFPLLAVVDQEIDQLTLPIDLGVQDLSSFPPGSYTGAIAAESIEEFGVTYAILGHSERRRYFHETSAEVANKVEQAIEAGLRPIVCVDEEYAESQAAAIKSEYLSQCIVAYEPLEAIGSGLSQPAAEAELVIAGLRSLFPQASIIYGGSVSAGNVGEYTAICAGVLVGTHSLAASDFAALVGAA
jgi:triosephosphate isomerase (TIM)